MVKDNLKFKLPVSFFKEGRSVVGYCRVLDLSTCGKNLQDAQRMFHEAATIFFQELITMGTLEEVLLDLGWHKKNRQFMPPVEMLHTNTPVAIAMPHA